jgi:hypothetical protein
MGFSFNFGYNNNQPSNVETSINGDVFYEMFGGRTANRISDSNKIKVVINNPALLKVVSLDCDIFSLGKVNQYQNSKLKESDFLYSLKPKPNLLQSWTQFFWDYKFYLNVYGTAYLYNPNNSKNIVTSSLQWLNPANITFNDTTIRKIQKFIFSNLSYNDLLQGTITYTYDSGESKDIQLKEIAIFQDLTNAGVLNPLKGISRINALYKIINNSELALDAKGINLFLSGRFLVAGKADPSKTDFSNLPMGEIEKEDIEQKVLSNKTIHGVKSMIDIKRFVEDIGKLKIDESFYSDFFMFGSMFNIPRDILETSLRGSTYENQEKAMARLIEYCQMPKAQKLTDWFESQFDFQDVRMSWSHLMFNQVFEKEKAEKVKIQIENITLAVQTGSVSQDEANKIIKLWVLN